MAEGEMSPPIDTSDDFHSSTVSHSFQASIDDSAEASTSTKNIFKSSETSSITEAPIVTCHYPGPLQMSYNSEISDVTYSKDIKDASAVPGSSGLYNLGNTCFMNSGLQSLLASDQLVKYCLEELVLSPDQNESLLGRFRSLMKKIWSGGYSVIYPRDFKETLSLYHSQFQDYRQHDCQEFLALLLDSLHEQILISQLQTNQSPSCDVNTLKIKQTDLNQSLVPTQCSTSSSGHLNNNSSHWTSTSRSSQSEAMDTSQSNNTQHGDLDKLVTTGTDPEVKNEMKVCDNNSKKAVIQEKTNDSSDSAGSSTVTISNISIFGSEDSNQSTVSLHSSDSEHANTFKTLNIKTRTEVGATATNGQDLDLVAIETNAIVGENRPFIAQNNVTPSTSGAGLSPDRQGGIETNNLIQASSPSKTIDMPKLNNTRITSLASLEEYYSKDCKTLNTNMLFDDVLNNVNIDSDKFAKMDNRIRSEQQVNILEEVIVDEDKPDKSEAGFGIKDINLRADKKSRSISCTKSLPLSEEEVYSLNNIKRIKIEQNEVEKNIQMEELQKYHRNKSNIRDDLSRHSTSPDSLMEVEGESSDEEGEVNSRSSTVDDIPSVPPVLDSYNDTDEMEADKAWEEYISENNSVVVHSFQGQFKSTIVCNECSHISVTFEPFMYLSLPIPRALERQICVIVIRTNLPPTRYLLNMFKTDAVAKLRQQIKTLIGRLDSDIILAEVLDCHISRLLNDNVLLRYINDTTRKIYAFEMATPPKLPDFAMETSNLANPDDYSIPLVTNETRDIFSQMGTFSSVSNINTSTNQITAGTFDQSEDSAITTDEHSSGFISKPDTAGTGMWEWSHHDERINPLPGPSWDDNIYDHPIGPAPRSSPVTFNQTITPGITDSSTSMCGIADQWKSCAICLEELADPELLVHSLCGGTFCDSCLEMSMKHSSDNGHCCPICQSPASRTEDFIPLTSSNGHKPAARILAIPVCQRYMLNEGPVLFCHPSIVYLPSHVTGQSLYSTVNTILPPGLVYSVLLTDGQGKHCSRCQFADHCYGCVMSREGEITLQPGDHLAVQVEDLSSSQISQAASLIDHVTMNDLRPSEPATIYDCFTAFTQCEMLDEQNPWFCPQCRKNQCANKRMTVWRYPDNLIVHLKRFVFHEFSSTKIDNPVIFPQKNLDLTDFLSGPKNNDLQYDLYSVVCHFGGSNSGHYTAYTRHPVHGEWFYYNDETVTRALPKDDEFSSGYVLFYQKQGSGVRFTPPSNKQDNCDVGAVCSSVSHKSSISVTMPEVMAPEKSEEDAAQTFDFYS